MAAKGAEVINSVMSDVRDQPFDFDVDIDSTEYSRIMRRIGVHDGEPVTPVSAFSSSI
jgi:hypothetical protein